VTDLALLDEHVSVGEQVDPARMVEVVVGEDDRVDVGTRAYSTIQIE
jgi:hypothetical protein